VSGEARDSAGHPDRPVVELEFGIVVYLPEAEGEPWRAVFTENGQRRYRQGATEAKLAAKLEKITERLSAGAANMERPGADLIAHYLDPSRLPVQNRWSRKHAHTQRRLCERFAVPVIGTGTCQDIEIWHTQQIISAAPTAGEGARAARMLSALVAAGIEGAPRVTARRWRFVQIFRFCTRSCCRSSGESQIVVRLMSLPSSALAGTVVAGQQRQPVAW